MLARIMAEPDTEKRPEGDTAAAVVEASDEGAPDAAAAATAPAAATAAAAIAPAAATEAMPGSKHPSSRPVEAAAPVAPAPPVAPVAAAPVAAAPVASGAPVAPVAAPPVAPVAPVAASAPSPEPADDAITGVDAPAAPVAASAFPPSGHASVKTAAATELAATGGVLDAYEAVARSARLPDLVAITQKILGEAASTRGSGWDFAAKVAAAADDAKLSRADASTPFGNALLVLGSGATTEPQRALAASLYAHAIAEARRDDDERLAGDILWFAAHTSFDATGLLDRALGDEADDVWTAIGDRVRRIDEGKATASSRAEAILGCAALVASESAVARKVAVDLAPRLHDKTLSRLLGSFAGTHGVAAHAPLGEVRLEGEAMAAPRGPVVTTILAVTGILFVMHACRLVARLALAYKRPAEVSLSDAGITMRTRTEMLGRTLREREHVIVRAGLVRVVREVRYPRAAFYAGLFALALGSYVGVRAFVDGVRAASPSLLLTGLVVVVLGIAADFVLGSVLPGGRGRVRVVFVPRTGKALCVGDVDATRADDALARALVTR